MKLIADSGSTKTDWRLIVSPVEIYAFTTEGINPYFHSVESIAATLLRIDMGPHAITDVSEVYFYAAGANTRATISILRRGFEHAFSEAKIHIMHDLLGASRALFNGESGIAAILGTGSNSCLFIDGEVRVNLGGHGYILGDEGSGMHLGRKVIRAFMNDLMPADILGRFTEAYDYTKDDITYYVYKEAFPNRFLASFSRFVGDHIGHPYIDALIDDAFTKFFERYIIRYDDYQDHPLRIVGSIGRYFESPLRLCAERYEVRIDRVLQAPIDGLIEYHASALRDG